MNIIRLLLIGGLVYFAMQQKKEGTRNMVLIVTGLLAVCMLSKEGFTVDLTTPVTCTGMKDVVDPIVGSDATCNAISPSDNATCATHADDAPACLAETGGGSTSICTYTAAVVGIDGNPGTRCSSDDLDPDTGECQNGCTAGDSTPMETYFDPDSLTSLDLNYIGTGGDITTPENLASQFHCSDGSNPTVKDDVPPDDLSTPLDLTLYLQCREPPIGSPPSGSPPSGSPSSSGPSSSSPSPPGTCIPGDGKTDKCGDDWEWVTSFFGSPNPSKLCYKNSFLWPNAYCK